MSDYYKSAKQAAGVLGVIGIVLVGLSVVQIGKSRAAMEQAASAAAAAESDALAAQKAQADFSDSIKPESGFVREWADVFAKTQASDVIGGLSKLASGNGCQVIAPPSQGNIKDMIPYPGAERKVPGVTASMEVAAQSYAKIYALLGAIHTTFPHARFDSVTIGVEDGQVKLKSLLVFPSFGAGAASVEEKK